MAGHGTAGIGGAAALALVLMAGGAKAADVMPNPTLANGIALANVAISVSDLEKSTKFYQALGFTAGDRHEIPAGLAQKTLGVSADTKIDVRFVIANGMYVELVHLSPPASKPASTGSGSQLGLANFAFRVDNLDRVAKIVKDNGGAVLDATRTALGPGIEAVFCTDPDGTKLELVGPAKK
ncbi:MAG TPA: VOC family protein [Alphaproteobacteria bacterium]|jgi:catechol 2,3-dioxygenase-like lactoylglutathione lyase family enzyme|nr:VOC family protein [Alphaproteobacteria bacterium]